MPIRAPLLYQHYDNDDGTPVSLGNIWTYAAGTTDLLATLLSDGVTEASNPVPLDAAGNANVYLKPGFSYKFVVKDALGVTISNGVQDNIMGINAGIGNIVSIDTISELEGLSSLENAYVVVLGYYAKSDKIEPRFYYLNSASVSTPDGGAVIAASSGGNYILSAGKEIDAKWFGVTGDGTTNDYPFILNAVNYLVSVGGGTLIFSEDVYNYTSPIVFPATVNIKFLNGAYLKSTNSSIITINKMDMEGVGKRFDSTMGAITFGSHIDYVIPEWWGALGDNSADDAVAIQSAINSYTAIKFTTGKNYKFRPITIPSDRKLFSNGATLTPIYESSNINITISGASNVTLDGLKFMIPDNNVTIWIKSDSNNIVIKNCYFGALTAGKPGSPFQNIYLGDCTDIKILNNYFYEVIYGVIQETSKISNNILIDGNSFIKCYGDAVLQNNDYSPSSNWICVNNIVDQTDNGMTWNQTEVRGIGFTSMIGGVIANNTFIACKGDAATHIENVTDCIITGNVYRDNLRDIYTQGKSGTPSNVRTIYYVTRSNASEVSGTLTSSAGGTASIVWYDELTQKIFMNPPTGTIAVGNTWTCTGGGAGSISYIEENYASLTISNNMFFKSFPTAAYPSTECIALNANNEISDYINIIGNEFSSEGNNTSYKNSAIQSASNTKATIKDNIIKGFYYGIVGGVGGNTNLSGLKIIGNVFKRNVNNIRNEGTCSDLFIDDNTFVDGNIFLGNSSGGTNGLTKSRFSNNLIQSSSSTVAFESASYTGNEFYGNKFVSGSTLVTTPTSAIFEKFLNSKYVRRISGTTDGIVVGDPWVSGGTPTSKVVTGFDIDPAAATAYQNVFYTVTIAPASLADCSGVIVTAQSNGVAGQLKVSIQNLSGEDKAVPLSGSVNFSVYQCVIANN